MDMKIEDIANILREHIGNDRVVKINSQKYAINTGLMLVNNFDNLTIYLVEFENKLYFAEFGFVMGSFEDEKLPIEKMGQFYDFLAKTKIEFENDQVLLFETTGEKIYLDFNLFVMAIMSLQTYLI